MSGGGGAAGGGWAAWLCTPLWRRRWLWEMQLRPLLGTTLAVHAPGVHTYRAGWTKPRVTKKWCKIWRNVVVTSLTPGLGAQVQLGGNNTAA